MTAITVKLPRLRKRLARGYIRAGPVGGAAGYGVAGRAAEVSSNDPQAR